MNVVILCVRESSTRLPQKHTVVIAGKPVLQHIVERFQTSQRIDKIVVATSHDETDDSIADLCTSLRVPCHRGSLHDVVRRMHSALKKYAPGFSYVFRGLGDMPLFDVDLLDWRFDLLAERHADVVWVGLPKEPLPVYGSRESPWSRTAWYKIEKHSKGADREHVGQALYGSLPRYRVCYTEMLRREYYLPARLELDTPTDLEFFRTVFDELHTGPGTPETLTALRWLEKNPEVMNINAEVETKTLTSFGWGKMQGSLWTCPTCRAFPMRVVGVSMKVPRRMVTQCPRCGSTRDFSEIPTQGPHHSRKKR